MPFTSDPSARIAPEFDNTARAVNAILADAGSHDQRLHATAALKIDCPEPECPALTHQRCVTAAGVKPKHYVPTHQSRIDAAESL